jgi:hypothetical protein
MQRDPQKNNNSTGQENKLFGTFFIAIAIAVAVASIFSEIIFLNKLPSYYNAVSWIGSFILTFIFLLYKERDILWSSLQSRMKNSIKWPMRAKIINGMCWAGPFAAIPLLPSLFPYLILAGIGSGNISTYLLLKKYGDVNNSKSKSKSNNNDNNNSGAGREQIVVGLISLTAIPIVFEVHTGMLTVREDMAILLSRILISFAYAAGGIYAIMIKNKNNVNEGNTATSP